MKRDSIDFAGEPVNSLFRRLLFPTIAGMISLAVLFITDGAFIGHGVGSYGIASVNIASPIFTFITGLGLMLGGGCSIVASIHLSKGNRKAADINVTQAFLVTIIAGILMSALILCNLEGVARLFGSSEILLDNVCTYLKWIALLIPFNLLGLVGEFIIRLDGSPKYAMACTVSSAVSNIVLDWLFIFPFGWGLDGASLATGISFMVSGIMTAIYMLFLTKSLHIYRLKTTLTSLRLTLRNIGYQVKMGFSSLLAESAVSCSLITGNYIFMKYLGEDGVAAYSVACYCIPTAFMLANAITQSSQPIASFAYGTSDIARLKKTRNISLVTALIAGIAGFTALWAAAGPISSVFLDRSEPAFELSTSGLPYFSAASIFICINVVAIGFMQSMEQAGKAVILTLLRGFILLVPCFIFLPRLLGTPGMWMAMPVAEALTTVIIVTGLLFRRRKSSL